MLEANNREYWEGEIERIRDVTEYWHPMGYVLQLLTAGLNNAKAYENLSGRFTQMTLAYQMESQRIADKWRSRERSRDAELLALREKRTVSCPCPVGECRKIGSYIMNNQCWFYWANSLRQTKK